jgi:hypothetical protein
MSTDRETTRIVRSWLRTDENDSADRILGDVLDRLDATPQRRAPWWPARRLSEMNTTLKLGLAAAVVAVAVLVGINYVGSSTVGGPGPAESTTPSTPEATPMATPEPTPMATCLRLVASEACPTPAPIMEGMLPEGPHALVDGEAVDEPPPMTVTIPAPGWYQWDPGTLVKNHQITGDGAGIVVFYPAVAGPAPVQGSQWCSAFPPATTVDELVAALTAQASRDATEPVDVTVDGYAGKSITLHLREDAVRDVNDHVEGIDFGIWRTPRQGDSTSCSRTPFGGHDYRGLTDKLWILDVDGDLVVIDTVYYEGFAGTTPQEVIDEMEAIVGSITFDE